MSGELQRVLIIDGHPDPATARFVHALADAYEEGATQAGYEVKKLRLAELDYDLLRSNEDFLQGAPTPTVRSVQEDLRWCTHLVVVYPLWLGSMPALLKGLFEQALRPGFAFSAEGAKGLPAKLLAGRSARIIVTMGMPAFFYRWYFRAHSLKALKRNVLQFVGFAPIRTTIIGAVEMRPATKRSAWLHRVRKFGAEAR